MKESKQWICEICGTAYKDAKECRMCESGHVQPDYLEGAKWGPIKNDQSGYPSRVLVKMCNGKSVMYKRS